MREALNIAVKDAREVPVGAVVVKDGVIIAAAHNQREDESVDPFAHAEILAMRRAAKVLNTRRLTGCTLYVTLEPCPMCAGAMVMAGLDRCVFGAYDQKMGCCGSLYNLAFERGFSHKVACFGGVLEEACGALLTDFFERKRAPLP